MKRHVSWFFSEHVFVGISTYIRVYWFFFGFMLFHKLSMEMEITWKMPEVFLGCRICLSYLAGSDASGSKGNGKRMMQLLIQRRERYICIYVISRLSLEYASTCLYQRTTCRQNRSSVQAGINRVVVTSSIAAVGPPMKWMEAWFLTSEAVNFVLTQPLSTLREWAPSMGCTKLDVQLVIGCKCVIEGRRWWQGQGLRQSRCWNVHLWLQLQHWSFVIIEFDNLIRS